MSFDVCVFYTTKPLTDADALKRYFAFCKESDLTPYIEPSPKISEFVKELTAIHPQIDDTPEDQLDDCPWSIAFDLSEGHVLMPMRSSSAKGVDALNTIIELAKKHGLVCFDPQGSTIVVGELSTPNFQSHCNSRIPFEVIRHWCTKICRLRKY